MMQPEEIRFINYLKQVYNQPVTLVDVGANKGMYTHRFRKLVPCKRVHLFEPNPELYAQLPNSDVYKKYNMALGAENTTAVFNLVKDKHQLSSIVDRPVFSERKLDVVKHNVEVRKLQDIIQEEHIDILKIDTEGYELEVLYGSAKLLEDKRIDYIQFEYGGCSRDTGLKLNHVIDYLRKYSYGVYDMLETGFKQIENYKDGYRLYNFYAKKL